MFCKRKRKSGVIGGGFGHLLPFFTCLKRSTQPSMRESTGESALTHGPVNCSELKLVYANPSLGFVKHFRRLVAQHISRKHRNRRHSRHYCNTRYIKTPFAPRTLDQDALYCMRNVLSSSTKLLFCGQVDLNHQDGDIKTFVLQLTIKKPSRLEPRRSSLLWWPPCPCPCLP